ncbi:PAS domain-containing protein [Streptomyces sp. NPDC059176]|uniref:PAS domain-containing protein n=1 Tax=unclassified Streptomyces TaxID=2593676 RepID=UPI00368A2311
MSSRPSRGAARLAAILDALPDGLVLVNCNGTVVNANTIALEMFETPGTALVGRGLLDLLPSFDSKLIPGSMRRPDAADERGRTKPTRMVARRTDGGEFPVEVTSASLEDGRAAYAHSGSGSGGYTGDELLMLVVRDLSGTVDTEAELARSQRQTEMILRAAAEGVVGTDTDGRVVLVNPAAAQILGFRASDLGGKELHTLVLHSRPDGEPFPYDESPLADTLRSGRKHRVRGQVLWAKNGKPVPVDLTTAPVRDGDQLVGAVLTFTDRRPFEELTAQHAAEVAERDERHKAELAERDEKYAAELSERDEKYAAELADRAERYATEIEERDQREAGLTARHAQLTAVLGDALRGPLEELRGELGKLAADPAGQLWPEANQILHHLAAGYARMTTLVDNVLGFQRLHAGSETLAKATVLLDAVVAAGVEGAVELIGPGRAQFAVHAPPIEAEVDAARMSTALAHLVADVAGVDSTGKARAVAQPGGYVDSTIVVAAAQRGDVVRIEVRGPYAGGDPVHEPIVRGIVAAHGGVLQTHEVPGMSGNAYVLEVPLGAGAGTVAPPPVQEGAPALPAAQTSGGGRRRARRASTDAFLEGPAAPEPSVEPSGRRRARPEPSADNATNGASGAADGPGAGGGTGRRRGRPSPAETGAPVLPATGSVVTAAEASVARPALGEAVPPQGVGPEAAGHAGTGRRARRPQGALAALSPAAPARPVPEASGEQETGAVAAIESGAAPRADGGSGGGTAPTATPAAGTPSGPVAELSPGAGSEPTTPTAPTPPTAQPALPAPPSQGAQPEPSAPPARDVRPEQNRQPASDAQPAPHAQHEQPTQDASQGRGVGAEALQPVGTGTQPGGRRARRALGTAQDRSRPAAGAEEARSAFALPPAGADRAPESGGHEQGHDAPPGGGPDADHTPAQPHPVPTGRRRGRPAEGDTPAQGLPSPAASPATPPAATPASGDTGSVPLPPAVPAPAASRTAQPLPAEAPVQPSTQTPTPLPLPEPGAAPSPEGTVDPDASLGRSFSVKTLGQGVPLAQRITQQGQQAPAGTQAPQEPQPPAAATGQNHTLGSGRRRKLATPPEGERAERALPEAAARPHPQPQQRIPSSSEGRAYAIGAPDEGSTEGPEPLDGPGGAVEVANRPAPLPVDDELPPEPLDNPRRLLVWPAPDVATQQALSNRGYRPVIVHSREEVDAQIAAFPAALFVDPLTGPITRTALQSLRQAAVAAEVPVLLAAGLGQATREAAYGADPAVLLKALAPRDSEQHPSRVLLIEEHDDIAAALTATLERRGLQVARAGADAEAVTLAQQMRPNLVVMDLMQVRRRRAGIIDWLRANGQLNRTPLVVYTSAGLDQAELPKLSSGETVLFLAERSTSAEVQGRIVDLLAKIGTN